MYFRPEFYSCTPQNHIEFVGQAVHKLDILTFIPEIWSAFLIGFKHLNPFEMLKANVVNQF